MLSVNAPIVGNLASSMRGAQVGLHRAFARVEKATQVFERLSKFQKSAKYEQTGPTNFQTVGEEDSSEVVTLILVGFWTMSGMGVGSVEDAKATLEAVLEEIKGIGLQIGKLGSNFSLIEQSSNFSGEKVAVGQVAFSRINQDEFRSPYSNLQCKN